MAETHHPEPSPLDWVDLGPSDPDSMVETYSRLAGECGVVPNGETISEELHRFLSMVVDHCANLVRDAGHPDAGAALRVLGTPEPFAQHFRTMLEHHRRQPVWDQLQPLDVGPTVIRLPHPIPFERYYGPHDWAVPMGQDAYRIEQHGDEWTVTFLPLGEVVYRGPGPVHIFSAPKQVLTNTGWTSDDEMK